MLEDLNTSINTYNRSWKVFNTSLFLCINNITKRHFFSKNSLLPESVGAGVMGARLGIGVCTPPPPPVLGPV